jgi:transcriptional regulator with XRE-family HTH domain
MGSDVTLSGLSGKRRRSPDALDTKMRKWYLSATCTLISSHDLHSFLTFALGGASVGLSKKIAYRLRVLRESVGLSQQEVADRADLSLSLIAKIEQGRKADPRASTLLALADALGVRAGQLIEELKKPPEDAFLGKGKKKKDKKKKLLAALVGAGAGPEADGESGPAMVAPVAPSSTDVPDDRSKKKKKKDK